MQRVMFGKIMVGGINAVKYAPTLHWTFKLNLFKVVAHNII